MRRSTVLTILLLLLLSTFTAFAHEENEQANKAAIQLLAERGLTGGNPDVIDQVYDADALIHLPPSFTADPITPEAFKFIITSLNGAMPDFEATLDLIIAEEDWVAYRLTWHGTFENPMQRPDGSAFEPTGNPILLSFNTISQFNEDGRIVEEWTEFDNLSWLTQLGVIPAQESMEAPTMDETPMEMEILDLGIDNEMRAVIMAIAEQAFNQGNVAVLDEVLADDYVDHLTGTGREEFKRQIEAFRGAFPDLQASIDVMVIEGNWAAFRFSMQGTFENELLDPAGAIPPTGQPVQLSVIIIARFNEDGVYAEDWEALDSLGFLTQLGVIPVPEAES